MSDDNNQVVVVKHIITEEVKPLPKETPKETEKEDGRWCWTRIQEARKRNANDTKKCWNEVIQILLESCGVFILFVIENIVGIVFFILGIVFLNQCPIRQAIPISLIVFGVFSIIHGITVQLIRWKYFDLSRKNDGFATCAQVIILIATIVHFIALFLACYLVFNIHDKVNTADKGSENYCHPFLYWFSFWCFVVMAIIGFILILLLCCLCCFILSGGVPISPPPHVVVIHHGNTGNQSNSTSRSNNEAATAQQPNTTNQTSAATPSTPSTQSTAQ